MKKILTPLVLGIILTHSSLGLSSITLPSDPNLVLCPGTSLMESPYQDTDYGTINASFTYQYGTPPLDSPPLQWTDGKTALFIDKLLVLDESEGCFCIDIFAVENCWCNGPWGNWHNATYPLRNDPSCNSKSGAELLVCQNQKMIGDAYIDDFSGCNGKYGSLNCTLLVPPSYNIHISGPFLSNTQQCEWWDVDGGTGATPMGPQYVDYTNLILWDWDDWAPYGVYADAAWIDIWEGDEGWWEDELVSNFIVTKESTPMQFLVNHVKGWLSNTDDFNSGDLIALITLYLLD